MTSPVTNLADRRLNLSEAKRELLEKRLRGSSKLASPGSCSIPVRTDRTRAPLSSAQARMWFFSELQRASAVYNLPYGLRLQGKLNPGALRTALEAAVARHEILRTRFVMEDGAPIQVIAPAGSVPLRQIDLTALAEDQREAALKGRLKEEFIRPFDLACDLMIRATLVRLGEDDHVFALTLHHIASDLSSTEILFREVAQLYDAAVRGVPAELPALPIQYGDYAAWEGDWLRGQGPEPHLSYWKAKLAGAPALLELPTDRPRPASLSFRGAVATAAISGPVYDSLQQLSRREGVTLFMTLLAGFQVLLGRLSRQSDIVVGIPAAGRLQEHTPSSLGLFVNTLALRSDLSGDPPFRDLLQQVRTTTLEALSHQELPFNRLIQELRPARDSSYSPLVQVMFTLQRSATAAVQFPGLAGSAVEIDPGTSRFDLTLVAEETPAGLALALEYSTDLFDPATAARLLDEYGTLLAGAAANPAQSVARLPLLPETERRQLLIDWNRTERLSSDQPRLHELFEHQVRIRPSAPALVAGRQRLTYQVLDRKAEELARRLRALGVGPEVRVAIFLERTAELAVALLAVLKAGGAYVAMDPAYPAERLAFIVFDSQASVVLTQTSLRSAVPASSAQLLCVDDGLLPAPRERGSFPRASDHNLAYVIYTSGSTGKPKGVAIEHRNAVNFVRWAQTAYSARELDGVLFSTSICFDLSIFELFVPLSSGGKVILAENGLALADHPAAHEVRLINTVPSVINELIRLNQVPRAVDTVNLAGEAVPQELVNRLYALPQITRVCDLYGPTETSTYSTCAERTAEGRPTIGRPIANTTLYILDRLQQPVPVGVTGELFIGGAGVARGYLDRPDLNAERFLRDPFSSDPAARLYRTGDHARYRADGQVEFLGRADQQVKIRGFRIELGEIEAALRAHPGVAEAAVTVLERAPGDRRLVAYVVPKTTPGATSNWRSFLQNKLPDALIPSNLVALAVMPRTTNGKIDRKALPAPEFAPAPGGERTVVSPRDKLETDLTRVWENVLGVTGIGVTDAFFDLGGHSLLAVRLAAQIEKTLGLKLPVAALFRAPTVEKLAQLIRGVRPSQPDSALLPIQPHGTRPPLFLVHGMGGGLMWGFANLARYFGDDQPVYAFKAAEADEVENFNSVEKMAAHYLATMRQFQPQGPYRIGGYCFGGNVAYEMARMLEAQGERASLVVLMNSWPANSGEDRLPIHPVALGKFLLNLGCWAMRLLRWHPAERGKFFRWKLSSLRTRIRRRLGLHRPDPAHEIELFVDLAEMPRGERKLWAAHLQALKRYHPGPYQGKITLLRTHGYPLFCSFDQAHGWNDFARGGVAVHFVPGSHETLMTEPHVGPVARELMRHLDADPAMAPAG